MVSLAEWPEREGLVDVASIDLFAIKNGTITVLNCSTETHRTFKFVMARDGAVFVSLLIGPSNDCDFMPFAICPAGKSEFFAFRKLRQDSQWAKLATFLNQINFHLQSGRVQIYHAGSCVMCGRKLTTPESLSRGFGPVCASYL
ncbi:MAG: DUF6011 domain-containing protein [Nannocystaceae bacterium]